MSYEETTTPLTPPTQDDRLSIFDLVGRYPAYERRMDVATLREHSLQDKALLGTLPPRHDVALAFSLTTSQNS